MKKYSDYYNTQPQRADEEYETYEAEDEADSWETAKQRRRHRRHPLRKLLLFLLLLTAVAAAVLRIPGDRLPFWADDRCNLLLCGTDREGYRTDTILLLSLDRRENTARLLSLPRDTYVAQYTTSPKLNAAYAAGGQGADGMRELSRQVEAVTGIEADGYMLIDLDAFIRAVDALGGVDFDVPMDMYYEDWDQDLLIDLRAGEQHLNGEQAMGLVRFRSGYATADIGRTAVQRDFIRAALRQWLRPSSVPAIPELLELYHEEVVTDLSVRELLWLGTFFLHCDIGDMNCEVLPGYSSMINGASCWIADSTAAAPILDAMRPGGKTLGIRLPGKK